MEIDPKYFDYAASSPVWSEALEVFTEISQIQYANPSSNHLYGKNARIKLLELKKQFCDLLQFYDGRLLFCASGSEANNTIIEGHLKLFPEGKLLIAEDVHDSMWYASKNHSKSTEILKIDAQGRISRKDLERAIKRKITLVCLNHVCNETGTIQAVKELSEICIRNKVKVLIDGVQAVGHIPVNLDEIPCTYYTLSGHKFGAVRSAAGALIRDSEFNPLIHGGKQEWNLRAGTENIAGLASMVIALKKSIDIINSETERLNDLVCHLISRLKNIPRVSFNTPDHSAPGILSISFSDITGREIVGALSLAGFAISTGSACHANEVKPSRIILSLGRNASEAKNTVRISMGRGTSKQATDDLANELLAFVMK